MRFAKNNEVSLAEAKKMLKGAELAEFHWVVKKYIKYGEKNALNGKLKFPDHYVNVTVTVDDAGIAAVNGKKIVLAGTILGGGFLADDTSNAVKANCANLCGYD